MDVKETVARLDSSVTALYGWEPRDSTYNQAIDQMVSDILDQYQEEHPDEEMGERTEHAIEQKAYDDARATWAEFKRMIDADQYEEALEFYLREEDSAKKNAGDFLLFLKNSTQRFVFYSRVLLPMMQEYKDEAFAMDQYIDLLELEKVMEDATIGMNAEVTGYVPDVYPEVIQELGTALVSTGKMDEAQALFDDLVAGVYSLTGDALFANFYGTRYSAGLYIQDGKPDFARATWENFRDYLNDKIDDYPEDDLADALEAVDVAIESLK